jgi:hypothetical protein
MNIIRGSVIGLAGAVGAGVLAWPVAAVADNDEVSFKRQEVDASLVALDDEDDDDTNARKAGKDTGSRDQASRDTRSKASKQSRSKKSRDKTNSRKSKVSRDRDRSRGDLTRDWTRDGGDRTRDWSANKTNDKSRNDTRRR